jgi:hypothetical protein
MSACDTSKIFGYFDNRELCAWDAYFEALMSLNPNVQVAEAHFYCTDHGFPYYAKMERGSHVEWRKIFPGNLACYTVDYIADDIDEEEKEVPQKPPELRPELVFDRVRYVKLYTERRLLLELLSDYIEESLRHFCAIIAKK